MGGRVGRAGDRSVSLALADHQVGKIERIFYGLLGLLECDALCVTHLMIERRRLAKIVMVLAMIEYLDAVQVRAGL